MSIWSRTFAVWISIQKKGKLLEVCLRKNKVKKLLALLPALILTGCIHANFVPFQPQKMEVRISDPTEAFGAAIDCASRAVRPPSTGNMFTYQSEKYNKFILTFLMDSGSDPWSGVAWNVDSVMRYTTSSDGKKAILEVTDMRHCGEYGCTNLVDKDKLIIYNSAAKRVMNEIAQCMEFTKN